MANKWIKWVAGPIGVGVFTAFLAITQTPKDIWSSNEMYPGSTDSSSTQSETTQPLLPESSAKSIVNENSDSSESSADLSLKPWVITSASQMESLMLSTAAQRKQREALLESLDWGNDDLVSLEDVQQASAGKPSAPASLRPSSTPVPTLSPTSAPAATTKPKSDRVTRRS